MRSITAEKLSPFWVDNSVDNRHSHSAMSRAGRYVGNALDLGKRTYRGNLLIDFVIGIVIAEQRRNDDRGWYSTFKKESHPFFQEAAPAQERYVSHC